MKLTSCSVGLFILWFAMRLAADQTVEIKLKNDVEIKFTFNKFTDFYHCLCDGTAKHCFAFYSKNTKTVKSISSNRSNQNDNSDCKYYKCLNILAGYNSNFNCTHQEQPSCEDSYEYLQMPNKWCGSSACVAFLKDNIEDIDYSNFIKDVKNCRDRCTCSTTAISKVTISQSVVTTSSIPARSIPVKSKTTTTISLSSKSEGSTTRKRKGTTTKSSESTTKRIRTTTKTNITVVKPASNSDNKQDNTSVIIGVIVPLGIIAIIGVIVAVFLWRRKKRSIPKHLSMDHDYANIVKTTASSQKKELQPLPNTSPNASSPYYDCATDNVDTETYTFDSVNNVGNNPQVAVNNGANKLKHDFVYSKAGSSEKTSSIETQLIRDTSSASVDKVDNKNATPSAYYSVASKPKRNPKHTKSNSITGNSITNSKECLPQKDTKGIFFTSDSQDNRMRFGYSQNGEENSLSQYITIEPAYSSSHLNSLSPTGKVAKEIVHTAHKNDSSTSPNATVSGKQSSLSDPPASHDAGENVEYSLARMLHVQEQHGDEQSHVYAKLHEDPSKMSNLYDHLPQPNQTATTPTCNEITEDTQYSIARLPYSTENPTNINQESEQSNVYSKLGENPSQVTNIYD